MKNIRILLSFYFFFLVVSLKAQKFKMNLMECVEMAVNKNISIKQIELRGLEAVIDKNDAKGNFLPSINAQANHSWNIGLNQDITRGTLENRTTQYTSMGANLSVDLYRGLRNLNQMYRANLAILASQLQLDDMKDDIRLMVANSYLQIMFNIEILDVQKSQLEVTKADADRTQKMIESGIRIKADLLEIDATMASQEQAVVIAENNLRLSKINLAQILLITDYENFEISNENYDVPFSQILDESPNHGGYSGQVSHIKVIIVSDLFVDKSLINRHKEVYRAMENYVSEIHAISIVAKSIAQWKESDDFFPSPDCAK